MQNVFKVIPTRSRFILKSMCVQPLISPQIILKQIFRFHPRALKIHPRALKIHPKHTIHPHHFVVPVVTTRGGQGPAVTLFNKPSLVAARGSVVRAVVLCPKHFL